MLRLAATSACELYPMGSLMLEVICCSRLGGESDRVRSSHSQTNNEGKAARDRDMHIPQALW